MKHIAKPLVVFGWLLNAEQRLTVKGWVSIAAEAATGRHRVTGKKSDGDVAITRASSTSGDGPDQGPDGMGVPAKKKARRSRTPATPGAGSAVDGFFA